MSAFPLVFLCNVECWLPAGGISGHTPLSVIVPKLQQPHPEKWSYPDSAEPGRRHELSPPYCSIKLAEVVGSFVCLVRGARSQARVPESDPGSMCRTPELAPSILHQGFCRGAVHHCLVHLLCSAGLVPGVLSLGLASASVGPVPQ